MAGVERHRDDRRDLVGDRAGVRARAARHRRRTSIARSRRRDTAFESWSRLPVEERAQWLEKLSAAMKTRVPQIAEAIAHEVGTALGFATKVQAEFPIMMIGMNAKFIREAKLEEELGNSLVIKEPIGVVGCVTPWNYPLHQVVCKIAPALAAGCTIVLKPAEMAPLSAFMLAEAAHEIGLPERRAQHRLRLGPRRRRSDRRASRCRHGELHRIAAGRPAHRVGRGRRHQEGVSRARRQVRVRRPRRCAVRQGDSGGREQLHAELRADLLGVDAHARAADRGTTKRSSSRRRSSRS